jgi:hypothetical protein
MQDMPILLKQDMLIPIIKGSPIRLIQDMPTLLKQDTPISLIQNMLIPIIQDTLIPLKKDLPILLIQYVLYDVLKPRFSALEWYSFPRLSFLRVGQVLKAEKFGFGKASFIVGI